MSSSSGRLLRTSGFSPQIHQRHGAQIAAQRDVLVGLPGYRRGQEPDLFDDAGQVAAPSGQQQLQERDRHSHAALAIRWRRLGVRLSGRKMGGRLVQVSLDKLTGSANQRQLGVCTGARREARNSAWMVCACPSSVRLNEWSASSRAASGQSPAACVCRMASTTY